MVCHDFCSVKGANAQSTYRSDASRHEENDKRLSPISLPLLRKNSPLEASLGWRDGLNVSSCLVGCKLVASYGETVYSALRKHFD